MNHKIIFRIFALALLAAIALAGVSSVLASGVTTDAIAGTWYGNMSFSNRNSVERIKFVIPAGCEDGDVCGSMQNYPAQCTWEITYDGYTNGQYSYHFSNTLEGECPAGSYGVLTLQPDGKLYRVHTTPAFQGFGYLSQLPNVE